MREAERSHAMGTRAAAIAAVAVVVGLSAVILRDRAPDTVAPVTEKPTPTATSHQPEGGWPRGRASAEPFQDCENCPAVVAIPGGRFAMGLRRDTYDTLSLSAAQAARELPLHWVRLKPISIGQAEVTRAELAHFVEATGARIEGCEVTQSRRNKTRLDPDAGWRHPGFEQTDNDPAVCISWTDAQAYVGWLTKETGHTYRLPTEAEWEWAARAGTNGAWFWGSRPDRACRHSITNAAQPTAGQKDADLVGTFTCEDGFSFTAPIGSVQPNPAGLVDMLGNAAEWVEDCMTEGYQQAATSDPGVSTADCAERVVRGGSWNDGPLAVRASARQSASPDHRSNRIGFRVVRETPIELPEESNPR